MDFKSIMMAFFFTGIFLLFSFPFILIAYLYGTGNFLY